MNKVLTNIDRMRYFTALAKMHELCPELLEKKIPEANIQQAFVLQSVLDYPKEFPKILSVGAYEDTASESLRKLGYDIVEIDPDDCFFSHPNRPSSILNITLHDYRLQNPSPIFDCVIATSVIEHVPNDEEFIEDICKLLKSNGQAILTCDFNNSYKSGSPKPSVDVRLYTEFDLTVRLGNILALNDCYLYGDIDYSGEPDFTYQGIKYSFATYVFRKK